MGLPATRRRATYADVLAAPPHTVAEVIDGALQLLLQPRPARAHAAASSSLGEELGPPFKRGRGGPGGRVILHEPELHLGDDIVVPDLAVWRRERMPVMTTKAACVGEHIDHAGRVEVAEQGSQARNDTRSLAGVAFEPAR